MSFAIQRLHEIRAQLPALPAATLDVSGPQPLPWNDPAVADARREAARLGVLDQPIPAEGTSRPHWVDGPELCHLSESVQELVCPRAGWTPAGWAAELRRKAGRCEAMHPAVAARYRISHRLLSIPRVRRGRRQGNQP